ncbi:UNVERIFIED_CONTAM: hypothetical protein PYX00_001413 [Menopon gallinae]
MLRRLYGKEIDIKEESNAKTPLKKSNSYLDTLTPETDLFYTPKCSPSEIQKAFCQTYCDSPIKRTDSDITSYYKIVSVDDIQIDERTDQLPENAKDEEHLEKELAEQEELFLSFKSIFSKVNKEKPNSQQGCHLAKKKESPRPKRKVQTNVISSDAKVKAKLPLWRPNTVGVGERNNLLKKNSAADSSSPRRKLEVYSGSLLQEARKLSSCSEMDVSTTGADSGLETSSSCQPEASPRENTVSETSGVDLTEAAFNEEIPHDEETESTKPAESIHSSSSSDVGTWDANDESRAGSNDKEFKSSVIDGFERSDKVTYDENGFCQDTLNEEEIARLDAMEKNIRECETFLDRERQIFYCFDNNPVIESGANGSLKTSLNSDQTISVLESVKDVILQNKLIYSDNDDVERENNNISSGGAITNDCDKLVNIAESEDSRVLDNCDSVSDSDIVCKNLINNEHSDRSYSVLDINNSRENDNCGSGAYKLNAKEILQMTTPPCSPRQICKPPLGDYSERKSELIFPDVKSNSSVTPAVNNYFIDASSLLDEDEIISPPVSLLSFKTTGREVEDSKQDEEAVTDQSLSNGEHEKLLQIQEERRQGDLIFKNSIPHFSRHEVQNPDEVMGRFESSLNPRTDDSEQVVPSADIDEELSYVTGEEIRPVEEYMAYSLPVTLPSDFMTPKEEMEEPELECSGPDGPAKKLDAESLPIVSGGLVPEDFSTTVSHVSSPHLRRRNESAPILSGGSDYVEEEKKKERKPSVSHGEAWVVSFTDDKPRRRRQTTTTTTSESDLESLELNNESLDNEKQAGTELKEISLRDAQSPNAKEANNEEKFNQRTSNPVEKSASLGYFIEFSKKDDSKQPEHEEEETNKTKQNGKKNMFSMFIDMKDDDKVLQEKTVPSFERQNTYDKEPEVLDEGVKKPFYMFIESDSPAVRRKFSQQSVPRKVLKSFDESSDRANGKKRIGGDLEEKVSKNFKGSSQSLLETSIRSESPEKEPKSTQVRHSKLPLPLCKSSSLSSVNGDARMVVWSEKKEQKTENSSGETWLRTNDIQITYKGRRDGSSDSDDFYLKKGSTFVIPEESSKVHRKSKKPGSGFHLRTVEEAKSPFKCPEERDSGVIVTEESDDSFVKLSDMDNYKNPYLESGRKKPNANAMSQSIPENGWVESKPFPKVGENDNLMSRSSIGTGLVKSSSGTAFPSDKNVSRSLSRLFPNLNLSNSFGRKSTGNVSSKQDTDPSDTQGSEVSEMSSMQSSIEPSGLETSTETDVSCHNGTSRLGEDLLRMFLEEISPDVVVEVGGRRMKAHKCILSSRCQYFAAMLSGGWVESAGNVISLQGFSYNSVHFALCHIYSGENRIPDSLNIIELATLADMLCLEGLKEVISHTLKVKYCHCFHLPCDECHVGVLDCLPVAAAYGLDDLYRKCLRWITKHFVKIWPSKTFASLPKELLDKCYQHHVVHMTVENVLDTILNIDTVRGSLPNVRWSETISRLVTKLHDAAVKYIADHFSSILTSDNFLALGKEAGWSVGRLEDSLMKATKCLPPEQACWSHARLHRILTVAKGPDPPSEMDWNGNFIDLLQCISGHVENSLIKQAPRAAKSKAWRQMEPELRSKIQERACLVLPDDTQSPKLKRTSSVKRESRQNNISSSAARTNSRNLEIRNMKIAMTQQANRTASLGRLQHSEQRSTSKEPRSLKPVPASTTVRKVESVTGSAKKTVAGVPETKKVTPSRFMDVKSRYLEPKSPQRTVTEKPTNVANLRRSTRPLSSSDSSRNCSPLNANPQNRTGANARQHRDSVVSTESATSCDGKRDRSYASARCDTPSAKTLSRLTADDNMSTDSLFTDSLYSEKDATTKKCDDSKLKGKENVRKTPAKPASNLAKAPQPNPRRFENSTTAYKSPVAKKIMPSASETKIVPPKRFPTARTTNVMNQKASPGRASLASPRNVTNRNLNQKTTAKYDPNVINGNTVKMKKEVDSENNKNSIKDDKRPSTVSRSGTFLKDEPTILKKPQTENIESGF